MTIYDDLKGLRLHYLADNLEQFASQAESAKMKPMELIGRIVELEQFEHSQRGTARRLKESRLGRFNVLQDFDWNWPKQIDRKQIEGLLNCDYIKAGHNIIFAGPQ
ncbi:MAG: ATP-binding protein [Oligoflexus sp.]|nr:ATP-binding protein [Oligoflexus sp.]